MFQFFHCFGVIQLDELFQAGLRLGARLTGLAGQVRGQVDREHGLGLLVQGTLERQLWTANQRPDLDVLEGLRHLLRRRCFRWFGVREDLDGNHGFKLLNAYRSN